MKSSRYLPGMALVVGMLAVVAVTNHDSIARAQAPKDSPVISEAIKSELAKQQAALPKDAAYQVGYSEAYDLVMSSKNAILAADQRLNVPVLGVDPATAEAKAFDVAVRQIAGTRIPDDFLTLAKKRVPAAGPLSAPLEKLGADPTATKFDWRSKGKVPSIRDQRSCGSCWCFAAVAAFEGNELIRNGGDPGDLDASEQHILNCGNTGGCTGDWYWTAWQFMESKGTAKESDVPYRAAVQTCSSVNTPYRVRDFRLVNDSKKIPSVTEIKRAICTYGPIAVAVQVDPAFLGYHGGVFDGGFQSNPDETPVRINHAVTLIGWDDTNGAWLLRNQYGRNWGESGYMWIKYDRNNVGYAAAWAQAK